MKKFLITRLVMCCTILIFLNSCEKDDFVQYPEFLFINDVHKPTFSNEDIRIFKEASQRMSDNIVFEKTQIRISKTAKELNIDQKLFDKWYYFIKLYNDGKIDIKKMPTGSLARLYSEDKLEGRGTRGGNILCDMAACSVHGALGTLGWRTSQSYFDMWYFDNRSSAYTMSFRQWQAASNYAIQFAGSNYQNNPTYINGELFYANQVSYYNADYDLAESYGTATVYFNQYGQPVGFKDTYDFNKGNRGFPAEDATGFF